ncbi:MAG: 16S rRNA (cytosine(967)-C(5))-methyltransferase RsmB [Kofleriaceae bacterium]|nr:16S rRNA (cytosine(967)-C(5))-methyltransferase RsmB [Kofleriaceae bacterium]
MAGQSLSARVVARRALTRVEESNAYATLALSAELSRARLSTVDSRLATEICYGVLRHRSRIDRALGHYMHKGIRKVAPKVLLALRVAAYQILFLDRIPDHAAVDDAVGCVRRLGGPKLAGFANGVLRKLGREGEPALPEGSSMEAVMVRHSMPAWIAELLLERVGEERLEECVAGMQSVPALCVRVNRQRTTRDALAARLAEGETRSTRELSEYPWALELSGLGSPLHSQSFADGMWTVQDLAAQCIGAMVPISDGMQILDACAGVGGKTTHLAEVNSKAHIDAIDLSPKKIELLQETCKRLGITSIRARIMDATRPDQDWTKAGLEPLYDLVLLDAPCSGLGVLRRHPERKWRESGTDIPAMVALQKSLLDALAKRVKPGGHLIYSVCTFSAAEGPEQLADFLANHPEFELDPPKGSEDVDWPALLENGCFVSWPHQNGQDAFFAACLRRR